MAFLRSVYDRFIAGAKAPSWIIAGDSAGGGLALAFAQQVVADGLPPPDDVVLVSPWLDIELKHPDVPSRQLRDPWLNAVMLRELGQIWRQQMSARDPHVSPIHGCLDGLRKITLLMGDRDIFWGDGLALLEQCRAQGIPCAWMPGKDLCHVWPLLPIPEAQAARHFIASQIKRHSS